MGNRKDHYYNKSKQEGYRSRAAYKLAQIDREVDLLHEGATAVDLGAAPGGWMQVAAEAVGPTGTVVGVDFQRIDPLDDVRASVEAVRGDVTEESTRDDIRRAAAPGDVDGAGETSTDGPAKPVDIVLSDMAPNMTGEYDVDHARSVHLARTALETAEAVLADGGHFAVKVFDGRDFQDFVADVEREFNFTRVLSPDASRDSSSELYVVGKSKLGAPVREGDVLDVEIVDTGDEGDGVAKVEGFTLFVPDAAEGETVEVAVTGVKPRFGFAERTD